MDSTSVRKSRLTTPGWTTASRLPSSISRILFILVSTTVTAPSTALAAPVSPDPAPRGTSGTPADAHARTTAATCAVVLGNTTANGEPDGASGIMSRLYEAVIEGSTTTPW